MSWLTGVLTDLGTVERGRSRHRPRNDPALFGGTYPFFQTGDVKAAELWLTEYSDTYNEQGLAQSRLWPRGTLCITIAANIGEAAILAQSGCFPDSVVGFTPHPDCSDVVFVKYLLDYIQHRFQAISRGTTQDNLSLDKLLSITFKYPPLATQHKIAAVLSAYDDLIENNNRRIKLLEEMARRIYREWFVDFRYPGHKNAPLRDSELGQIPPGWTWRSLFDVAEVTFGYPFKSELFNTKGDGTPLIRIRDLQGNRTETFTTEVVAAQYEVIDGDLLIGMDGDFHMCKWASGRSYLNQRVCRFRPRPATLGLYGTFLALQKPISEWNQAIVGTTVAHLGKTHLELIRILTPPPELAAALVRLLDPIFDLEIALGRELSLLRRWRDVLLPRLISGEIDVDDLSIDVPDAA